jgi:Putative metallopeptidase
VSAMSAFGIVLPRPSWWPLILLFALMSGAGPLVAQPAPSQSSASPQSPAPPGTFQARIDAAARALRESNPRFKNLSPEYVQGLAEFVSGNMLFVLLHELAHAAITQMGLPVLGRMEDAADSFAALRLIRVGSDFSRPRVDRCGRGLVHGGPPRPKDGRQGRLL